MICRRATDFTDLEMIEYYPKYVRLNMHGKICTLKNHFLWFTLSHMTVMKIKISTKKMIVKFIYVF